MSTSKAAAFEPNAAAADSVNVCNVINISSLTTLFARCSTITLQNPSLPPSSVSASLRSIMEREGYRGLWHGTSAGLLKTVPKYVTSVAVKDFIGEKQDRDNQRRVAPVTKNVMMLQSGAKSILAGVAGAALTNPADVLRNEMFKEGRANLGGTLRRLNEGGAGWMWRGLGKNLLAVAAPVRCEVTRSEATS